MLINYNKRIDEIFKKIEEYNDKANQVVLDMIIDLESDIPTLYFRIKVLDKNNYKIVSEDIRGYPKETIDKYVAKYKMLPRLDIYKVINGNLVYQPTLSEQDEYKDDIEG